MPKNKVPLSEGKVNGNLDEIKQVYKFNYLPQEIIDNKHYTAKIELAIMLEKEGLQQGAYRSLRFCSLAQMKGFISNLIKAYIFYGKQLNEINPRNFEFKLHDFQKFIDNAFRGKT